MNMAAPQFWQEINPFHSWKGYAALMCHAICVDWLMVALSSTPCCQHEQPLPKLLSMRASVPTIPWMGVRLPCQICWCHFGFFPLIDVLLKPTPAASEWDSRLRVGCYTTGHAQTDRQRLINQNPVKGSHKCAVSCAIPKTALNISALRDSSLCHNCLNMQKSSLFANWWTHSKMLAKKGGLWHNVSWLARLSRFYFWGRKKAQFAIMLHWKTRACVPLEQENASDLFVCFQLC